MNGNWIYLASVILLLGMIIYGTGRSLGHIATPLPWFVYLIVGVILLSFGVKITFEKRDP